MAAAWIGSATAGRLLRWPCQQAVHPESPIVPPNQSPQSPQRQSHPRAARPQASLGALPRRFLRQRVLIVGCGDVGQRVARLWAPKTPDLSIKTAAGARLERGVLSKTIANALPAKASPRGPIVRALTSSADKCAALRALGITPLVGNLDERRSLRRLAGLAPRVIHLAPPGSIQGDAASGTQDLRTRNLLRALVRHAGPVPQLVYGSTSGVYGDWGGAWVDETCALHASTARALRRVDAEQQLRRWALRFGRSGAAVHVLRIPGIYAGDREGGTPVARLQRGTPVLRAEDDVFTSHIHADDLARAVERALWRGQPQRVSNVADQTALRMGDYFDLAADLWGLLRPPRISRADAAQQLSPVLLSFMSESRRLSNTRMRRELGVVLRYPTVVQGLAAARDVDKLDKK